MRIARLAARFAVLGLAAGVDPASAAVPPTADAGPLATTGRDTVSTDTGSAALEVADDGLRPRTALIRSALLPGWGQYSNGNPLKAALFGGAAAGFLAALLVEHGNLGQTNAEIRDARAALASGGGDPELLARIAQLEGVYEDRAARRNTRLLYVFTTATLAALDAYVDAHLADFGPSPDAAVPSAVDIEVGPRDGAVYVDFSIRLPVNRR